MSEPTYRIELTHHPENNFTVQWMAAIYAVADGEDALPLRATFDADPELAFDAAQAWCKAKAIEPHDARTVFLTEDGELLDPFDTVQT